MYNFLDTNSFSTYLPWPAVFCSWQSYCLDHDKFIFSDHGKFTFFDHGNFIECTMAVFSTMANFIFLDPGIFLTMANLLFGPWQFCISWPWQTYCLKHGSLCIQPWQNYCLDYGNFVIYTMENLYFGQWQNYYFNHGRFIVWTLANFVLYTTRKLFIAYTIITLSL